MSGQTTSDPEPVSSSVRPGEHSVNPFSTPSHESLIDLDRYPIADRDGPAARRLVATCRKQLKETSACVLPGFLRPEAIDALVAEAAALAPLAYFKTAELYTYSEPPHDAALPEDHPRRHKVTSLVGFVGYDAVPQEAGLRRLYEWDALTDFVRVLLGKERLYRYGDPIASLTISVMNEGDHQGWHFDLNDFIGSVLLQEPEGGGEFEYVSMIRTPEEENYADVRRVLAGNHRDVIRLHLEAGTFVLFQGRHSIHRVIEVIGRRPRLIALLAYDTLPDQMESDYSLRAAYGRSETIRAARSAEA